MLSININKIDYAGKSIDEWYDEVKSYDFSTGDSFDGKVYSHFTQLVWNTSVNVAFGIGLLIHIFCFTYFF